MLDNEKKVCRIASAFKAEIELFICLTVCCFCNCIQIVYCMKANITYEQHPFLVGRVNLNGSQNNVIQL